MTRINGQKDDNYYLRQADIVIFNNADNEALFNEFNKLKELTR